MDRFLTRALSVWPTCLLLIVGARFLSVLLLGVLSLTSLAFAQDTIIVPTDYDTIQEAVDVAVDGDTVLVEAGIYSENVDLQGKAIVLEACEGPEATTIDGRDLTLGTDFGACITTIADGDDLGAQIVGFRLTSGEGSWDEEGGYLVGGGIYAKDSRVQVLECEIEDSGAEYCAVFFRDCDSVLESTVVTDNPRNGVGVFGGALRVLDCDLSENERSALLCLSGHIRVRDTRFEFNEGVLPTLGAYGEDCSVQCVDCVFRGNAPTIVAVVMIHSSNPILFQRCEFIDNDVETIGATVALLGSGTVSDCLFSGNSAFIAGALNIEDGLVVVERSVLVDNSGELAGAVLVAADGAAQIDSCTIANNDDAAALTLFAEDALEPAESTMEVLNSVIWGNESNFEVVSDDSVLTVEYSCIDGGEDGVGNIDLDPEFIDSQDGDYRLSSVSPCIDAGHPRTFDIDGTRADMGALPILNTFIRGDVNGNGEIGALTDSLALLEWWFVSGESPRCLDAADVDDNGRVVPLVDVLALLQYAYADGDDLPEPSAECGIDLTQDSLTCLDGSGCQ